MLADPIARDHEDLDVMLVRYLTPGCHKRASGPETYHRAGSGKSALPAEKFSQARESRRNLDGQKNEDVDLEEEVLDSRDIDLDEINSRHLSGLLLSSPL